MSVSVELAPLDSAAMAAAQEHLDRLTKPPGSLGRLEAVVVQLAGITGSAAPRIDRPAVVVFAGDHGVTAQGVSAYPGSVTAQMVANFEAGGAAINVLARAAGARLVVVDVGVAGPGPAPSSRIRAGTRDMTVEPAMARGEALAAIGIGRDVVGRLVGDGCDVVALGEMGIGNTTAAAAVCAAVMGGGAADWTGRGTGVDDEGLARKLEAVEAASARARGLPPLDVLREVGGAELVAIAGAAVEARRRSMPVVLDGFVVGASVAPLHVAHPGALDHCLAGHRSAEAGHALLLERLAMTPLLDLGLRLGEGSGALVAVPIVRLAAAAVTDVATFEEWGLA
jgi:nicotinate-nucleotide--dimethylbenzimidazole phosphoribosyltransferase